jgi:uncharacterized membrane protein
MVLNLLLLMAVAFIPYPTRLVADAIRDEDAERAAVIFYGLSLLLVAIFIAALWASIARDRGLLKPDVSDAEVSGVTRATTPNIGFYIAATVLAVVVPRGAAGLYLVIAAVALVRVRGDSRAVPRV